MVVITMKRCEQWGRVTDPEWDLYIDWLCDQHLDEDNEEWFEWAQDVSRRYGILVIPCVYEGQTIDTYCYLYDKQRFLIWQIEYADYVAEC